MTLQSSGAISLADVQTEFGGANPIGINEYYSGGSYVLSGGYTSPFTITSGNKAPVYGSGGGTYPPSGWTGLQNYSVDDESIQIALPFTFSFNNTGYTTVFIGSNGYLTFGSGSSVYSSLSASNPAIPKLMFGAADNSYQRISSFTSGTDYVSIRYEGNASTNGLVGSPGIVAEITLYNPSKFLYNNVIEMLVGNNNRTDGVSNISNASTAYATYTFSANTSYVFTGNSTGTSWTVNTGSYVTPKTIPASGTISLYDFYGIGIIPSGSTAFWTQDVMGTYTSYITGPTGGTDNNVGNIVTPGASASPAIFNIERSADPNATGYWGYGLPQDYVGIKGALYLYVGGTIAMSWEDTTGGYHQNYYTATFGSNTMQFISWLSDVTSDGIGYYNKVTAANLTRIFYHYGNYVYSRD